MTFRMLAAAAATSLVLAAGTVGPASAQQSEQPVPGTVQAAPGMELSEEKLERFAVAYVQVVRIGDTFRGQIEAAETDAARAAVQQEAEQAMVAAVDDLEGLSVEEYSLIFNEVQADPALAEEVQQHINEAAAQ